MSLFDKKGPMNYSLLFNSLSLLNRLYAFMLVDVGLPFNFLNFLPLIW